MNLNKNFITESINGTIIRDSTVNKISSVSIDSRKIRNGELFIAIKGENYDGHNFVEDALNNGAVGAIVEKISDNLKKNNEKLLIKVNSTEKALADLSHRWRKSFNNLKLSAITGSNGKTTTKEMTFSILSVNKNVLKNSGNFNNNIGVPLTLLNLNDDHQLCVVELGMNNFGEIRFLTEIAEPDIGAITNIGRAHLEKLGSLNGVAKAKAELVKNFTIDNTFCVNIDDPFIVEISAKTKCKKLTYSLNNKEANIFASDIKNDGLDSITFKIHIENKSENIRIKCIGIHNVLNSLCASAIATSLGYTIEEIQAGLERYKPSQMRLEVIESPYGFKILNDAYNANPDSMVKGIDELENHKSENNLIAIIGDMLELGSSSTGEHKNIGKYISRSKVDIVIAVGKDSKHIIDSLNGNTKGFFVNNHKEASDLLIELANPEDVVLVKGSRGMKMENVIQNLY